MTTAQRLALSGAFDAMDPDAKRGLLDAFGLTHGDDIDDTIAKGALIALIDDGVLDYGGVLAFTRRAGVGMPVPDERETQRWWRTIRGLAA